MIPDANRFAMSKLSWVAIAGSSGLLGFFACERLGCAEYAPAKGMQRVLA